MCRLTMISTSLPGFHGPGKLPTPEVSPRTIALTAWSRAADLNTWAVTASRFGIFLLLIGLVLLEDVYKLEQLPRNGLLDPLEKLWVLLKTRDECCDGNPHGFRVRQVGCAAAAMVSTGDDGAEALAE